MKRLLALIAFACTTTATVAHEFWIQPGQFRPDNKAVLGFQIRVGDGFPGEIRPRDPTKLVQFFVEGPGGRADIPGVDGRDPAGLVRLADVGVHVACYTSNATNISLDAAKFEAYLKEEGLEEAITERAKRGESEAVGTESFRRCAKSIFVVEKTNAAEVWKKPMGMAFELIPQSDPYALVEGGTLTVQALADSKPQANALVRAQNANDLSTWVTARTDAQGMATITIAKNGVWLINSVNIVRQPEGSETTWLSTWASLTFELGQAPMPAPATPAAPAAPAGS